MAHFRITRAQRMRLSLFIVVFASLAVGLFAAASAQGRECVESDRVMICAEKMIVNQDGSFLAERTITIGLVNQPPLIEVRDMADQDEFSPNQAFLQYNPADSAHPQTAILSGEIVFLNDLGDEPLIGTLFARREQAAGIPARGRLHLNLAEGKISIPAEPLSPEGGIVYERHEGIDMVFVERAGLLGIGTPQWSKIDATIDMNTRIFEAMVPLTLNGLSAEEPVIARVRIDEGGIVSTSIAGFQAEVAGLKVQFEDVQLLDPFAAVVAAPDGSLVSSTQQAQARPGFRIGRMEIRKADNPDLPSLDPTNPDMIFRIEGAEYRNGRLTMRTGAHIRDWSFGNAFALTNQQIGLGFNQISNSYQFSITSTLTFGGAGAAVNDTTRYPITLTIAGQETAAGIKPLIRGTLGTAQPNLGLGPLRIKPQQVGLEFNAINNFYGLVADQVALQWNTQTGGQSGPALQGFRLGVDRNKNLVFNLGSGAEIELPEFRSAVLTGKLRGSIQARNDVLTAIFSGTMGIAVKGNNGVAPTVTLTLRNGKGVQQSCPTVPGSCLLAYEMGLSAFELKIAGFTLALSDVRGIDGGGIAAGSARLRVPNGISVLGGTGAEVRNIRISGSGTMSIDGGGIELPTFRIGGFEFASARGFFAKTATDYEFRATANVPLPGMSSGSGKKLTANLTFRLRPDGSFLGAGVRLDFATGSPGIPLGTTGMELTRISGSFETSSGRSTIGVSMRAVSQRRIGSLPIATVDGEALLQINPFKLTANARLSLLVFEIARASVGIGAGQGFNGDAGFNVQATVDLRIARGELMLRMGRLTLSNGTRRISVAIRVNAELGVRKGEFGRMKPPTDITLGRIELKGGDFQVKDRGEVLGVMGRFKCCVFFSVSFFINLSTGDIDLVNAENYKLIGGDQVRALAAQGVAGYHSQRLNGTELSALVGAGAADLLLAEANAPEVSLAGQPDAVYTVETIPITVTANGGALFGIAYPAGSPNILVQGPDGKNYNRATADNVNVVFMEDPNTPEGGRDQVILLHNAQPGTYTMMIVNPPEEYENISYSLNAAPTIERVEFDCGSFDESAQVTTTCDGVPTGDGISVAYRASDQQGDGIKVYAGLAPLSADGTPDTTSLWAVEEGLPLGRHSTYINTTGVPSGRYRVLFGINDGANTPVEVLSDLVVEVEDRQPPAPPRYLISSTGPGLVLARWEASPSRDVAGYELGYRLAQDPVKNTVQFTHIRDLGSQGDAMLDEDGLLSATIWGLADGQAIYFSVRSYDQQGNRSLWTAPGEGRPWPVSPDSFSPLPDGSAYPTSTVRLMFDSPLALDTLPGRLGLYTATGVAVPGEAEVIRTLDGTKALGLRFTPAAPLQSGVQYEVMIKGGGEGIMTEDGRSMPDDYRWRFSVVVPGSATDTVPVPPEPVAARAPPNEGGIPDDTLDNPPDRRIYLPLLFR